jgi:hypothetical protein
MLIITYAECHILAHYAECLCAECHCAECCYAKHRLCRLPLRLSVAYKPIMLSVVVLSVIMLIAIMQSVFS